MQPGSETRLRDVCTSVCTRNGENVHGAAFGGLTDRIVEAFPSLPMTLKRVIFESAWQTLSDGMKRRILASVNGEHQIGDG